MHRFYVPDIDATDRSISLDGSIARQLKTVLRADTGEHIRLFDGSGSEWEVEIDHVGKNDVSTTLVSAVRPVAEPVSKVTMLLGLARPERIELAIQKCTELGAVRFVPVMSERVQGGNTGMPSDKRLERWQRIAIEA
ncbi:MAG: RsmE family RNA methyltransferase, partial [Dehalococcoidia bacterium]